MNPYTELKAQKIVLAAVRGAMLKLSAAMDRVPMDQWRTRRELRELYDAISEMQMDGRLQTEADEVALLGKGDA